MFGNLRLKSGLNKTVPKTKISCLSTLHVTCVIIMGKQLYGFK